MSAYHSVSQIGRELGKSPPAIIRLIHSGQLPAIRTGRTYRIARSDLVAYLERARVRPRSESERLGQAVADHRHQAAERRCLSAGL
jgi:excisionase family DNA binding protein